MVPDLDKMRKMEISTWNIGHYDDVIDQLGFSSLQLASNLVKNIKIDG